MSNTQRTCRITGKQFVVTEAEQKLLEAISPVFNGVTYSIPLPTLCPIERRRRRFTFRNDRNLYHRKCDLTGKEIISIYSPDSKLKVYSPDAWWGDAWDGMDYGRDFDFNRSFFEQFDELMCDVPQVALWNWNSENSEYTHSSCDNKNCYMLFATDHCEDAHYNYLSDGLRSSIDNTMLLRSELCYECIDSEDLYNCRFSQDCKSSSFLDFCVDCIGCESCIGCVNLRNKKYCAFNEQLTKEEWESHYKNLDMSHSTIASVKIRFQELLNSQPRLATKIYNGENCVGNYIRDSKNITNSFEIWGGEDIWHSTYVVMQNKNIMDGHAILKGTNIYESMAGENINNAGFILWINNGPHNSYYCLLCVNGSQNCFGCVGLKKKQYCIFNKQYTKEEYEQLVPKIIEHMEEKGEWGEFFPSSISPFVYNETIAQDFFPLTENEAKSSGYRWRSEDQKSWYDGPDFEIPNSIEHTSEDICKQVLHCEESGKPYKIIPQEYKLYKDLKVAIPKKCFDRRHTDRLKRKNPWVLWDKTCQSCNKEIQTSFPPESKAIVYCEECYRKEVY